MWRQRLLAWLQRASAVPAPALVPQRGSTSGAATSLQPLSLAQTPLCPASWACCAAALRASLHCPAASAVQLSSETIAAAGHASAYVAHAAGRSCPPRLGSANQLQLHALRQQRSQDASFSAARTGFGHGLIRLPQLCQTRGLASRPVPPRGGSSASSVRAHVRRAQAKGGEQALYLGALVVAMVGATYASVPLYRMFCQATGFGGTVQTGRTVEDKLRARQEAPDDTLEAAAASRLITVSFNADVVDGMPWRFQPTQRSVKITPGQSTLAFYTAENTSSKAITGVSTYNVTPQQAGQYFNKIQCFCFEEQKLRPHEKVDMPVFFYVDPEFATDPRMKGVDHLTLSYTFFMVDEEDQEEDPTAVSVPMPVVHSHAPQMLHS